MTADVQLAGDVRQPDAAALHAAASALVPTLGARARQTEAKRKVPAETIADFQKAGFFRVLQPRKYGGYQMEFSVFANLVRELAHGCASSAWVYAVTGELGWVMAMFPEQGQEEVWGSDPSAIGCAAIDPAGRADEVAGGYRLSGRWRFVSGSDHAQWAMLTAPCGGQGTIREFLVRRDELETVDDWHVLGLVGTGSRTLVADEVFVPAYRTIAQEGMLNGDAPGAAIHADYPVCRTPRRFLTSFSLSPVLLGLAERALTIVLDATAKKIAVGIPASELDGLQLRIMEAAAAVETARAIFDRHMQDADARLAAGVTISDVDIQKNRMMGSHMIRVARDAIDQLCRLTGSGWIFDSSPLNVVFRDAVAGATHRAMSFDANAKNYARSLGLR